MGKATFSNRKEDNSIPMVQEARRLIQQKENQKNQPLKEKMPAMRQPMEEILGIMTREDEKEAASREKTTMERRIRELEAQNLQLLQKAGQGNHGKDQRIAKLESDLKRSAAQIQALANHGKDLALKTTNDFLQNENTTVAEQLRMEKERLELAEQALDAKNLEIQQLVADSGVLKMQLRASQERIRNMEVENQMMWQLEHTIEDLLNNLARKTKEVEDLKGKLEKKEGELKNQVALDQRVRHLEMENQAQLAKIQELETNNKDLMGMLELKEKELKDRGELAEKIQQVELENLAQCVTIRKLEMNNQELMNELEKKERELTDQRELQQKAGRRIEFLEFDVGILKAGLEEKKKALKDQEALVNRIRHLDSENRAQLGKIQQLESNTQGLMNELEEKKNELKNLEPMEKRIQRIELENQIKATFIESLENKIRCLNSQVEQKDQSLNEMKESIRQVELDNLSQTAIVGLLITWAKVINDRLMQKENLIKYQGGWIRKWEFINWNLRKTLDRKLSEMCHAIEANKAWIQSLEAQKSGLCEQIDETNNKLEVLRRAARRTIRKHRTDIADLTIKVNQLEVANGEKEQLIGKLMCQEHQVIVIRNP